MVWVQRRVGHALQLARAPALCPPSARGGLPRLGVSARLGAAANGIQESSSPNCASHTCRPTASCWTWPPTTTPPPRPATRPALRATPASRSPAPAAKRWAWPGPAWPGRTAHRLLQHVGARPPTAMASRPCSPRPTLLYPSTPSLQPDGSMLKALVNATCPGADGKPFTAGFTFAAAKAQGGSGQLEASAPPVVAAAACRHAQRTTRPLPRDGCPCLPAPLPASAVTLQPPIQRCAGGGRRPPLPDGGRYVCVSGASIMQPWWQPWVPGPARTRPRGAAAGAACSHPRSLFPCATALMRAALTPPPAHTTNALQQERLCGPQRPSRRRRPHPRHHLRVGLRRQPGRR